MKALKNIGLVLCCLVAFRGLSGVVSAQETICAGLTGPALGLCTAAVNVGCDASATQPQGCVRIAEEFTQLTGQAPPWGSGHCLCYDEVAIDQAIADWLAVATSHVPVWYERQLNPGQCDPAGLELGIAIEPPPPATKFLKTLPLNVIQWDSGSSHAGRCQYLSSSNGGGILHELHTLEEVAACRAVLNAYIENHSLLRARFH